MRNNTVAHITKIKVRGYHIDLYGHVNNARYLEFLEEARWAMLDDTVDREKWHTAGYGLSVVNININYKYPANMGDDLEIQSSVSKIGNKSILFDQQIVLASDSTPVADALVTFVLVNRKTGHAITLTGKIRKDLEKLFTLFNQ